MKKLKTKKKVMKKKKAMVKKKLRPLDLSGDDPLDQDFSNVDFSGVKWFKFSDLFEFEPKNKTITFRMPESMLEKLKLIAAKEKTDYQKLIREALADLIVKRLKKAA